uniref:Predicted ribosomal protein S20 n=1 Tax=uncultured marine gamma proteobacterium EBAC20E09 TaxID=266134 RepID=Q6Q8V1_9GAMM|nr:predicted ribosomal protein S20 [uncultured marine gamma proteobacterium EBAC20E09]
MYYFFSSCSINNFLSFLKRIICSCFVISININFNCFYCSSDNRSLSMSEFVSIRVLSCSFNCLF